MEYPHYNVKRSTLHCDREGGRNQFVWNVWKIATEGQRYRCIGAYQTETQAQAAAAADRRHGSHLF
jgi:hypothetical protein